MKSFYFFPTFIKFSIIITAITIFPILKVMAFSDVTENHPNREAINYLQEHNIVQGYEDGSFKAENRINRAEFLKIIMESKYSEEDFIACITDNEKEEWTYLFLTDVTKNKWFSKYVCLAKEKGIIQGYPDGTFRPGNEISFVEAAKIIVNVLMGGNVEEDKEQWFKPYVVTLGNEWNIPRSIKKFDQNITRGEMAEMVWRVLDGATLGEKKMQMEWIGYGEMELIRRENIILAQNPNKTRIFLTALSGAGEYGKFTGCNDSIVGVLKNIQASDKNEIQIALEALFSIKGDISSIKDEDFKNLYEGISGKKLADKPDAKEISLNDSLSLSDIFVKNVKLNDGVAEIQLGFNDFGMAGDCTGPRFIDQIKETVLQFPYVQKAEIYIDGRSLETF